MRDKKDNLSPGQHLVNPAMYFLSMYLTCTTHGADNLMLTLGTAGKLKIANRGKERALLVRSLTFQLPMALKMKLSNSKLLFYYAIQKIFCVFIQNK